MKIKIIKTGKEVEVYESKVRDTYSNSEDCTTEYKKSEVKLL